MLKVKKKIGYLLIILGVIMIIINMLVDEKYIYKVSVKRQNSSLGRNINNISELHLIQKAQLVNYVAHLKIPKINLNKGLVDKESKFNNIDKNIQILGESNMPNVTNGNLILAAHSGNSNVSYFQDLNKLKINDKIYVEYNNRQYEYQVTNYYIVEKTGLVNIVRNKNKTTITLITCVEKANKQLVIICELYKIINL